MRPVLEHDMLLVFEGEVCTGNRGQAPCSAAVLLGCPILSALWEWMSPVCHWSCAQAHTRAHTHTQAPN